MLERSASSLELCAAHRILYRPTRRVHSCRRLHPAFWQHGAAALELSAAWAALQRARSLTARDPPRRSKRPSTRYDALESLYLSSTTPPLAARRSPFSLDPLDKRPYPLFPLQLRPRTTFAPHHLFAPPRETTTSPPYNARPSAVGRLEAFAFRRHLSNDAPGDNRKSGDNDYSGDNGMPGHNPMPGDNHTPRDNGELGDDRAPGDNRQPGDGNSNTQSPGCHTTRPRSKDTATDDVREAIRRGTDPADQVWELYRSLPPGKKVRNAVFRYLCRRSRGEADLRRCWDVISEVPAKNIRRTLRLDATRVALRLGMHSRALEFLRLNLRQDQTRKALLDGSFDAKKYVSMRIFKEIIRSSFETASWPLLWNACRTWRIGTANHEQPSMDFLNSLSSLEDTIIKFWQHLGVQADASKADDAQDSETPEVLNGLPTDGALSNAAPILQTGTVAEVTQGSEPEHHHRESGQPVTEIDSTARSALFHDVTLDDISGLLVKVARAALLRPCAPNDAVHLLHSFQRPELYEAYFQKMASLRTTHRLPGIFRECKRRLGPETNQKVTGPMLQTMFDVFYPHEPDGLLEVHRDRCRLHYERLGPPGDPDVLRSWWTNYAIRAVLSGYARDPLIFLPYVEEHERHGDSDTAEFAKELVMSKLRFERSDITWFSELKLYAERLDYEGAMEVWQTRFNSDKPDLVTLVTLLRLACDRGDVAFTTGLFDKARLWGLDREPEVLIPVIKAFGRHRSPREADNICSWAIDSGVRSTEVFNAMLEVYASLNRPAELHRLMMTMAKNDIVWDNQTYIHLVKALGRTKRGSEAQRLLKTGSIPNLTVEHLEAVMASAVKMTDYSLTYKIARRMRAEGFPMTLGAMSLLVKAADRWRQCGEERPVPPFMEDGLMTGKDLIELYRKMSQSDIEAMQRAGERNATTNTSPRGKALSALDEDAPVPEALASSSLSPPARSSSPLTAESSSIPTGSSLDTLTVKRAALTLAEMGDGESLDELASIYLDTLQRGRSEKYLSDGIVSAYMIVDLQRGDLERVKHLWQILWGRHLHRLQKLAGGEGTYKTAVKVPPHMQYGLDEGFRVMEQVLTLESNADGLLHLIWEITSRGFKLERRSWNHAIQSLASMGKWKQAFKFNEQMLMPNWTGWKHFRRFKLARRRFTAWEKHNTPPAEVEEGMQAGGPGNPRPNKPPPEDDPSLEPEERQYWKDFRIVAEFLRHMYTLRKRRRMQKKRKMMGTSIKPPTWITDPAKDQRYLRPNSHTLIQLARVYLEMEEPNSWVGNSQDWVNMFCPASVLAIRTLRYADEVERPREKVTEWDDDYEGGQEWDGEYGGGGVRLRVVEGEYKDVEALGEARQSRAQEFEDTGGPKGERESRTEGTLPKPRRAIEWKDRVLPHELRKAILNVLEEAPRRKEARKVEKKERMRTERKARAEQRQREIDGLTWERLETEAREREMAEWMRNAGIVDVEEVEEEPLTTENFFDDEADEESKTDEESEDGEEEEEEFERDPRRRRHKANRGRKKWYRQSSQSK